MDFKKIFNISKGKLHIVQNIAWASISRLTSILNALFIGILVARFLGPENYGILNYTISFVFIFTVFSNLGLDNIEIREIAKDPDPKEHNKIIGTAFLIRIVSGLLAIGLIFISLQFSETTGQTKHLILWYSSILVFSTFNLLKNFFVAQTQNKKVAQSDIIRTVLGMTIKATLVFLQKPLEWFVIAAAFDFLVLAIAYLFYFYKGGYQIKLSCFEWNTAKYLLKESFPLLLSGICVMILQRFDQIIIKNLLNDASLGYYAVASKVLEIGVYVPMIIASTVTPILVKERAQNFENYQKVLKSFVGLIFWISVIVSIGIFVCASPAINLLFGEQYALSIPTLKILSVKVIMMSLRVTSGSIILIEALQRYTVWRDGLAGLMSIGLNFLLIPILGIEGSAIAAILSLFFGGFWAHYLIKPYRFIFDLQWKAMKGGPKIILDYMKNYTTKE